MHFPTVLASIAAFSSAVIAAPPKEKPYVGVAIMTVNAPISGEKSTLPQNVPLGVLTHQDGVQVTELEIVNAFSTVKGVKAPKNDQIVCQMYKDQYGTLPGSAEFTAKKDAKISTNSVPLGWILCRVKASS
ncbi:hypothetical protein FVEN_g8212 [Fusarium venenatum]|uniref:Uncharacterized protein n=1 Tax=Fusarium venenatum TaxID=56646 RepID=A0A2L2SYN1_9HYPO|nr:uncharacterized protein FVRRES_04419 [Fusarium venenatum]KAG8353802.1 hypothetical protein FVEN_g8212 [Fusarium venenatum]KAH6991589.1 hypothetical protein EDB82DRAFT_494232 [Fusarium venenatum]CEI59983.1 unnamed protein product [Fusarium venenatum]